MRDDVKITLKAFSITAIIFIIVYFSGFANFDTNDDLSVISILKGYFGWQPDISPFLSPILSMMFIQLYGLNYVIPWFGLLQYLIMFVGMYWGFKILLSASWSLLTKVTLMMILLGLFSYLLFRPNFGATSLFAGFMAAVYVAYINLTGKGLWISYLLVGIMFSLAYMFKVLNIWIVLPIIFPVLFTFLLSSDTRKKFFVMLIPIVLMLLISWSVNSHLLDNYDSVQSVRSTFFSINFDHMTDSASLNAVGWNADDYYVSRFWFTYDQNIFGFDKMSQFLFYDMFHILIPYAINQIDLMQIVESTIPFSLMIIVGLIIILDSDRRPFMFQLRGINYFWIKWVTVLSLVTMIGVSFALFFYRFPPRVYIPLFSYVLITMLFVRSLVMVDKKVIFRNVRKGLLGGCLCFIVLLSVFQTGVYQKVNALKTEWQNKADIAFSTMINVLGNDTIFINGAGAAATFISTDPFKETIGVNYILTPPGWIVNTPTYYDFMKKYNISESDIIKYSIDNKKVVYSFFCQGWYSVDKFERYFNRHYGSDAKNLKLEVVKDFRQNTYSEKLEELDTGFVFMRLVTGDR